MTFFGWKKRGRAVEAENALLRERNVALAARLAEGEAKNLQLVQALAAAAKNSRNSSQPPSSDIVKPPPPPLPRGQRRKMGGPPGHPKQEHPAFRPEQIDHHGRHELGRCPVDASPRRDQLSPRAFARALASAENKVWAAALEPLVHPRRYPQGKIHRLIDNLVDRFCQHGEGYFRFITSPEIQPTNNSAEQAMRFVVMDRHMTQGTRSRRGRDFRERIWTVIATCALHKRSAYHWMHQSIAACFHGHRIPSLLLDSS